jgi:protein required for attachment to host cells
MEPPLDPTEHLAQSFANEVASYLDHARHEEQFSHLVLIAGPRFLGWLRAALSDATRATVIGTVDKNLQEATASDVKSHLSDFMI